jgi:putative Holliday junction resolvase
MSYLGLDVGEKRIGIALSDELNMMAHAMSFIERKSDDFAIQSIKEMITLHNVEAVVVGMPITLKGEIGKKAIEISAFADRLKGSAGCPILTWDERLTTKEAERALIEQDMSRAKRRIKIDALAAQIMLQSFLDYTKNQQNYGKAL